MLQKQNDTIKNKKNLEQIGSFWRTNPHTDRTARVASKKNSSRPHTNRERVTEQHKNNHISK